jgi:hypothetical protein
VIEDVALLNYFKRGLIPGPSESEEVFLGRVRQSQPLNHLEWEEASFITQDSFGFSIDWVPLSYSNHRIAWWEGAATWISDDHLPSIQLRKNFQKGSFLGYKRPDVLAHEAIHAARSRFEEPQFEEILAYATSPQAWKRFLGPLFSRTWEPLVLILSLIAGVFWPFIPLIITGLGMGGLTYRQRAFKRCSEKLSLPVVLCLTDVEIKKLARMSVSDIQAYLSSSSTLVSRLRLILYRNRHRL